MRKIVQRTLSVTLHFTLFNTFKQQTILISENLIKLKKIKVKVKYDNKLHLIVDKRNQ